jgi:hypothetical protein
MPRIDSQSTNWPDVLERSWWTALETTFGLIAVDFWVVLPDHANWQIVAIATGVAFVKNIIKNRSALWTT